MYQIHEMRKKIKKKEDSTKDLVYNFEKLHPNLAIHTTWEREREPNRNASRRDRL